MRLRRIIAASGACVGLLGPGGGAMRAADTIVPPEGRVDDLEARLTFARILSYRAETWAASATAYERILRDQPAQPAALAELAEIRIRQGDLGAAERGLRAALAARADNPAAIAPLARLLLWTERPAEADALLAGTQRVRALTPDERLVRAQTLSRLGRHDEAAREFEALLAAAPAPTAELTSAAADARLARGDIVGAKEFYARALVLEPTLAGAQRGYALTLAWTGDDAAARPRLEQVLRRDGNDADVVHAYLGAVSRTEGEPAAIVRARERAEANPRDPRWRAEWAELETRRGHALRAKALFAEALALSDTPELRLRAGRAAITWGDFNGTETALREALRRNPSDPVLRDELGRLLVSADRVEEAEQFYERWLAERPTAEPALLGLVRLRLKEKDFTAALTRSDAFLMLRAEHPEALRLRADALGALHRPREAADVLGRLALRPESRVDAELALGRIERELGRHREAAEHFVTATQLAARRPAVRFHAEERNTIRREEFLRGITQGLEERYQIAPPNAPAGESLALAPAVASAPELVEWAGLFAETGDFSRAVKCLKAARIVDPEFYPAWAQLAEFLAIDQQFEAALREFAELKKLNPANRQVLLGEARTLAWSRRYDEAIAAYGRLAALNPADPVPQREAARTAGWGKMRGRGAELYARMWQPLTVDRMLAPQLARLLEGAAPTEIVNHWRRWAENPEEGEEPFAAAERFARERFALRDALPLNRAAQVNALYVEILPALRLQRAWWLENSAKQSAWDRRYASAASTYRRLLVVEPGNEEALFDLSQAEAAQGLGRSEHDTLTRLLALDANHTLANHAVARRVIRSWPIASLEGRYWRERGRGELASLRRLSLAGEVQDTLGDQYSVRLGGQIGREMPLTRDGRYAFRGVSVDADAVIDSWLTGSLGFLHREFYDGRIGHADSGQGQLWLKHNSIGAGIGYEKREELANEFALFQGTRSDNYWLAGQAAITRRLDIDARLTATRYSDENYGNSLVIRPALAWTDHPRIFKTILTLEYRDTDRQSVYFRDAAGKLTGLIHPYWTPENYTHAALTLEWYHDLAREFFVGSEERYYDLRVTFGIDSESNSAITFEGDWHREWVDRWIAHASIYLNLSREWDALGLRLRLARRF